MKKLLLFSAMLCIACITNAQTLGYNDVGVLFSDEMVNGTARYNAMSGAFGALGGDLSGMESNPAGAAVFINSEFAASFNSRNSKIGSSYYGVNQLFEDDFTNISQAGGVFIFNDYNNSGWGKVALGFNYSRSNDFEDFWSATGNSNFPTWIDDPNDPNQMYLYSTEQYFENYTRGSNKKYSFTIASQYDDNLYVGFAINTYDISYFQSIVLEEYNDDNNGNLLDASLIQELSTYGDGFSFNMGIISKPSDNVRFGLAYQSPVWYQLAEDYLDYDLELYVSNTDETFSEISDLNLLDYKLRTPSKLTGSFAYIFDQQGLISVDYIHKNYSNIKLSDANFSNENQEFDTMLEAVGEWRLGTEWRLDNLSVRGGYHYKKSPYKNALDSDHIEGYSLGAGLKFKGGKFDISYQKSENTAPYSFYPQYNEVDAAELNFDSSKITLSLVLNI